MYSILMENSDLGHLVTDTSARVEGNVRLPKHTYFITLFPYMFTLGSDSFNIVLEPVNRDHKTETDLIDLMQRKYYIKKCSGIYSYTTLLFCDVVYSMSPAKFFIYVLYKNTTQT
jgi:hypothetical protein